MSERNYNLLPLAEPRRLEYGAVPLDPWGADDQGQPGRYASASFERITKKVARSLVDAINRFNWVESPELANTLFEIIDESLYKSQTRRVELNAKASLDDILDTADPRFVHAKSGVATPAELLALLIDNPSLMSIEIAKLSHPLDGRATKDMDEAVCQALAGQFGEFQRDMMETARYKTKDIKPAIPVATVLRKQVIASHETPSGTIQVVQRKGFIVRGDEQARQDNDSHLDRIVKNPERHVEELHPKIESYLEYIDKGVDQLHDTIWLQPLATSYYVKNVNVVEASKSDQR